MSVYFATACGYTKVGYSADPVGRMTTVTRNGTRPADIPFDAPAELLGWIPGERDREAALHREFAASRAGGEWFVLDESEMRDLIWADPHGVDINRMSMLAVCAARKYPSLTRVQLAAAGIPIEAATETEALLAIDAALMGHSATRLATPA